MPASLSDAQRRWLLEMVITDVRPKKGQIKPPQRDPLVAAGLVELLPNPAGRGHVVRPTEAGWAWVIDHLEAPFARRVELRRIWNALAPKLQAYLRAREDTLATVLTTEAQPRPPAPPEPSADPRTDPPQAVLRRVYLRLTGGQTRERVRLFDLRAETPLSRDVVDATLVAESEAGRVVLYPIDDRAALTSEDHSAALNISGVPKHVVYWEG